jgi:hypothetical protein
MFFPSITEKGGAEEGGLFLEQLGGSAWDRSEVDWILKKE